LRVKPELLFAEATDQLERKAFRGGAFMLGGQGVRLLLQLGSTAALARLLTPREFGIFGMTTVLMGFVTLINDLGLNQATVQRAKLDARQVSTLFWVNLGFSAIASLLVAACSPLMVKIFREPQLLPFTLALTPILLISGLGAQHGALLSRQLRFRTLTMLELVPFALGIACAVALAARGAGVWALVAQQLVTAVLRTGLILFLVPWLPRRPHFGAEEREMLRFGGNISAFRVINYLARNLDNALIGWYWDAATLAIYTRAYALFMAPMSNLIPAVRTVVETSLARVQHDEERFVALYKRSEEAVAWLIFPLAVYVAVAAPPVVALVLGPKWTAVVGVLRLLSLASLVQPVLNSAGWLLAARGRADLLTRWGAIFSVCSCASFAVAVPFGNMGMAAAVAGIRLVFAPIWLKVAMRGTKLTLTAWVWELRFPALATGVGGSLTYLLLRMLSGRPPLLQLAVTGVAMYGCVFLVLLASGHAQTIWGLLLRRTNPREATS
jgi:O-antigen/teichoic acid export membrane protein